MATDFKQISKFLATILRHRAGDFGITLDAQGFTDLDKLWQIVESNYGKPITRADFDAVLAWEGGKQRFEVIDGRIRAMYGHSTVSAVTYAVATPPDILYHGTVPAALASIREHGLSAMKRQYVHLSTDVERASDVGGRHGEPIILTIRAHQAHQDGIAFYHPEPKHYLARHIPPEYIDFPED